MARKIFSFPLHYVTLLFPAVYKDGGIVHEMHTDFEKSVVEIE
jgi:hypothetical protein